MSVCLCLLSVVGIIHKVLAVVCDTNTAGGDHVEEQIMSDITLRQSIEQEGGNFIQFLTNRHKIVSDVCRHIQRKAKRDFIETTNHN